MNPSNFQVTGVTASDPDDRDLIFPVELVTVFPERVSLRQFGQPIEDQVAEGSCTANAAVSILEGMLMARGQFRHLSRQQLYYDSRAADGLLGQEGAKPRSVCKVLKNIGVANESTWPYLPENENTKPSPAAYAEAATQKIGKYFLVPMGDNTTVEGMQTTIRNFKSVLCQGHKIYVAFTAYEWLRHLKGDVHGHAVLDTSVPGYMTVLGGHEVVIDGYDDSFGSLLFPNSWGPSWGDNGYGAVTYPWVASVFEARVFVDFMGPDPAPVPLPSLDSYRPELVKIATLYAALFGRAPDAAGLAFWFSLLFTGTAIEAVAQQMYASQPARDYFPYTLLNLEIAARLYTNVLGRTPDMDGLAYWAGQIDSSNVGAVVVQLINAVIGYAAKDAVGLAAVALLHNRTAVGIYYAVDLNGRDVNVAQHALDGVTADPASVTAAKARLAAA